MAWWIKFCGVDPSVETEVRGSLAAAGLRLVSHDRVQESDCGIVCFAEFNDSLLKLLQDLRRDGTQHLMAMASSAFAMEPGCAWRLLNAGASEALVWDGGANAPEQIRARLERWTELDCLTQIAAKELSLIGCSQSWKALLRQVVEAARFGDSPILIIGESGTGKEMLARLVHQVASRDPYNKTRPAPSAELTTVDCGTIVPELSGSELFGHERGAFTGAAQQREGAFALADKGTLFLDEIGDLPPALQPQLLRAVQEKTYKRVGGNVWHTSRFRLVCATNRDLPALVDQGRFRLDLYHRIAGWVLHAPPVRDRREDILPLASYFLNSLPHDQDNDAGPAFDFDSSVSEYLVNRPYPGNVRELKQLVSRIARRHVGPGPVTAGDIPEEDRPAQGEFERCWPDDRFKQSIADAITLGAPLKDITQAATDMAIRIAVQSEGGNLQRAARRLGVTDRTLQMRRASGKISGQ
ncbi:MAG TPA: sigma 54-interacting transcriptional regulator [Blastocatellia bacterium]